MTAPRKFLYGVEAKKAIFAGIKLLNDTTSVTLGPLGRNAVIHLAGQVVLPTKDGITVAEQVHSSDTWEQMGIQIAREASDKCNEESGDGTTSAVVMTHSMCKQALHLAEDVNVIKVKRGMQKAVDACTEEIKKMSVPCTKKEDFKKVALISSQDEEIADKVTDVFMQSGEHGAIDIEYMGKPGMEIEHTDGFVLENGCILPLSREIVLEDVPVLVTDKDIKHQEQIFPIMKLLAQEGKKRLFIVCENTSGEALGMIAQNLNKDTFTIVPVKVPSFGVYRIAVMRDVCAVTGAAFVSEEENIRLDKVTLAHLGIARKVTINNYSTVLIAGDSIEIKKRISDRVEELEKGLLTDLDDIAKEEVKKRLATLTNGVSVIRFGAVTEGERHEKKHRIVDAKEAVRSAREEGVLIGGGSSYLRCIKALEDLKVDGKDEQIGVNIVKNALRSITLRVLEVAGVEDRELIVSKIIEEGGNVGYNFKTGKLGDMMELGIVEPAKVDRCVIQNAASCAMTFLSLDLAIADEDVNPLETLKGILKG